tara:strand:+ start:122 stop:409 length:288 start_codon:yes stop_codon:yes gene_type:complete
MLKPIDARLIVKKAKREEQTASGIVLPDTVSDQNQTAQGEVVAVGPGSRSLTGELMPMSIKVGEVIIYQRFGGQEVDYQGQEYVVLMEKDVIAVC